MKIVATASRGGGVIGESRGQSFSPFIAVNFRGVDYLIGGGWVAGGSIAAFRD